MTDGSDAETEVDGVPADEELSRLYPGEPIASLPPHLRAVLPTDKDDSERVERVIALGYPAIEPILPHLFTWLQDLNWPIAQPIASYLATLGPPVLPLIRQILAGDDSLWKHWVLLAVVADMDTSLIAELEDDLRRLAAIPDEEDVHTDAAELLARLSA